MMENEVKNCVEVLKNGGIILYPTDTIWGIGCDATNENAVKKVFGDQIKLNFSNKRIEFTNSTKSQVEKIKNSNFNKVNKNTYPFSIYFVNLKSKRNLILLIKNQFKLIK